MSSMPSNGSPSGRSTWMTSAPWSQSSITADGPATPHDRSSTLIPSHTPMGARLPAPLRASSGRLAEDEPAGRDAGAGGDDHVIDVGGLARRRAPHQSNRLRHTVDAMDVGLAQLTA